MNKLGLIFSALNSVFGRRLTATIVKVVMQPILRDHHSVLKDTRAKVDECRKLRK